MYISTYMRALGTILFVVCCLLFGISSQGSASTSIDPLKLGVGARSLAMGRTNLAAPGDVNAIFVNPANAAYIDNWGVTSMYTSLLEGDITYTLLGGGKKFNFGGLGLAYLAGGTSGINVTTRDASGRVIAAGSTFDYSNSVIALSWGRSIKENLAAGAILKSFSSNMSGYSNGSGLDVDLGLIFTPREKMIVGLAAQNMLPTGISWGTGANEDVPLALKGGLSYFAKENVLVNADLDFSPFAAHAGAEWMVNPTFALRGGIDQVPTGAETLTNLCLGLGIFMKGFKFDYAYYKDSALDANSTHYFTLGYVAPGGIRAFEEKKPLPPPIPPKVKSETAKKIEAYILQLENKLKSADNPARRLKLQGMIEEQKVRLRKVPE